MTGTRTRLIVHIGGAKCGSTAIQNFMADNRNRLDKSGFIVPNSAVTSDLGGQADQVWFFHQLGGGLDLRDEWPQDLVLSSTAKAASHLRRVKFNSRMRRQRLGEDLTQRSTILLSAENLSNPNGLSQIFKGLPRDFAVEIVLYIRRQEEMFMSGWQQWFMKINGDLDKWIARTDGFFCDWKQTITDWESVGAHRFTVRLFDRASLDGGDVVKDFCHIVGLDPAEYLIAKNETNVSHGVHIARLIHDCRVMYEDEHDTFFEHLLFRLEIPAASKRPNEILFTPDQLRVIRSRFADGNAWIRARYFPDLERPDLFPELDYSVSSCPDQAEVNRRNCEVLDQILQKVPIDPGTLPAIDQAADPAVMRAQIAAATIELVSRLKREGHAG